MRAKPEIQVSRFRKNPNGWRSDEPMFLLEGEYQDPNLSLNHASVEGSHVGNRFALYRYDRAIPIAVMDAATIVALDIGRAVILEGFVRDQDPLGLDYEWERWVIKVPEGSDDQETPLDGAERSSTQESGPVPHRPTRDFTDRLHEMNVAWIQEDVKELVYGEVEWTKPRIIALLFLVDKLYGNLRGFSHNDIREVRALILGDLDAAVRQIAKDLGRPGVSRL